MSHVPPHVATLLMAHDDAARQVDALLAGYDGDELSIAHVQRAQARIHTHLVHNRHDMRALASRNKLAAPDAHEQDAQALLTALADLEAHASRAEASVGEITAEIRWLDMAKRNVGLSIVTLRRLQMLVSSSMHLEQLCETRQYRDAASSLQAVQALLTFFARFESVPCIAQQRAHIDTLREKLRKMVVDEYEAAFQQARPRWDASSSALPHAALVVDALGPDVRDKLVEWYCTRQLREYRRVFRAVDEAGQLDNVPRRYAWIRRLLRTFSDEHASAFLPAWHVDHKLLTQFIDITHEDMRSVLVREQPRLQVDVLLNALHATNEFEAQAQRQYGLATPRPISSAFMPYLGVYVDAQDKRLAEMMTQFATSAAATDAHGEDHVRVLVTSTELVTFYRQTLERCAQLGPKAPLADLAHVYSKWLKRYAADVLLPALHTKDALHVCTILNTADYCATTATQLAERLTEKIKALDPDAESVRLDAERDVFFGVISSALQSLVRALHTAIEPAFQALLKPDVPWAQREQVTDKSPWVDLLASGLESVGVVVRHHMENKRYVRSWCDKAASLTVTRLIQTIVRLRPIRQCAAKQLEHDVEHVHTLLLEWPHFSSVAQQSMQSAYTRIVDKAMQRIRPVLHMLTLEDEPRAFVDAYRTHVGDQNLGNFQKLLDLKGVRRIDQHPLVEEFLAAIDRAPEALPTTSALSSLQLDPNADVYAMPELGERNDPPELARPATPTASSTLSLPDWKKFGSMFGVLGQRRP